MIMEKNDLKRHSSFVFWILVTLIFVLSIGNLILTFAIIRVLRMTHVMESMEFIPNENVIKFYGDTDLNHIYKKDGVISSYSDTPLVLTSNDGSIQFILQSRLSHPESKLIVNSTSINLLDINIFEVRSAMNNNDVIFSSTQSDKYNMASPLKNMQTKVLTTRRVSSPLSDTLNVKSDGDLELRGAEGTYMESKELLWSADQDIYMKSINGSVILSGKEGIYVDIQNIPVAGSDPAAHVGERRSYAQFKVCVCMPDGKLFKLAVPDSKDYQLVTCSHINVSTLYNPCI